MAKDELKNNDIEKKLKKCKKISRSKDIAMFSVVFMVVAVWFGTGMVSNEAANNEAVKIMKNIKVPTNTATPAK